MPNRCGAGLLSDDDPRDALKGFEQVVSMETSQGEWCARAWGRHQAGGRARAEAAAVRRGFKALKQVVKVHYRLGNIEAMLDAYRWAPAGRRHTDAGAPVAVTEHARAGRC